MKAIFGLSVLLATAILMGTAEGAQKQRPGGLPSFDRILKAFDGNKDGAIEKSELPPLAWARIAKADANGDGLISEKEFDAFRKMGGK